MKSLGFIEVRGVVAAVSAIDAMTKTADVQFLTWEKKLGGRLVTVIVEGDVAAVTAAIEQGYETASAITGVAAKLVIANPHGEVRKMVELSKAKLK